MAGASGKKLDETYKLAWVRGLKTTYYLRTLAATSAEKSTGQGGELNAVSTSGAGKAAGPMSAKSATSALGAGSAAVASMMTSKSTAMTMQEPEPPKFCAIDDPTCEACQ